MQRIISSIDSDVGPRASIQSTSALLINKTLTFHIHSQIPWKSKIILDVTIPDWLSHCTLSFRNKWRTFRNKWKIRFPLRLKEERPRSNFLKETSKGVHTSGNVKLTIQSARIFLSLKFNTKTSNNCNGYLKQISVRILLKQLDYSLLNPMRSRAHNLIVN